MDKTKIKLQAHEAAQSCLQPKNSTYQCKKMRGCFLKTIKIVSPSSGTFDKTNINVQKPETRSFSIKLKTRNAQHYLQVILFEINCAIFYTNLHELFLSVHKLNKLGKFW